MINHPYHSSSIILDSFEYYSNLYKIHADIKEEIVAYSNQHRVQIQSKNLGVTYNFAISLEILHSAFRDEVYRQMSRIFKDMKKKKESLGVPTATSFDAPFTLTHQEEIFLQEELQKVKEGFYDKVRRDRHGNRLKPQDLEAYNKLDSFGEF